MSRGSMIALAIAVLLALGGGGIAMYQSDPSRTLARREKAWGVRIQPGDVVLQDLACGLRCNFIRDVTHTRYTQVGLVLEEDGKRVVWEAFQPVGPVPLAAWVDRGKEGRVAVYRPTFDVQAKLPQLTADARVLRDTPFDPDFQWDDARLYASELVEKLYEKLGEPLVAPHPMGKGGFASHAEAVRRLTEDKLTEQTPIVMPVDFTRAPRLHRVVDELKGLEP